MKIEITVILQIRKYIKKNKIINKLFSDGRLFYEIKITQDGFLKQEYSQHLCLQDLYRSKYEFYNNNNFRLTYLVQGPNKDYLIVNNYTRLNSL